MFSHINTTMEDRYNSIGSNDNNSNKFYTTYAKFRWQAPTFELRNNLQSGYSLDPNA